MQLKCLERGCSRAFELTRHITIQVMIQPVTAFPPMRSREQLRHSEKALCLLLGSRVTSKCDSIATDICRPPPWTIIKLFVISIWLPCSILQKQQQQKTHIAMYFLKPSISQWTHLAYCSSISLRHFSKPGWGDMMGGLQQLSDHKMRQSLTPVCDRSKCLFVWVDHPSIPRDVLTPFKVRACQLAWSRICVIRGTKKSGFIPLRIPISPNLLIFQTRTKLINHFKAMESKKSQTFVFHYSQPWYGDGIMLYNS